MENKTWLYKSCKENFLLTRPQSRSASSQKNTRRGLGYNVSRLALADVIGDCHQFSADTALTSANTEAEG
jgi:hypothetical protein